jgi:hypothetical protein
MMKADSEQHRLSFDRLIHVHHWKRLIPCFHNNGDWLPSCDHFRQSGLNRRGLELHAMNCLSTRQCTRPAQHWLLYAYHVEKSWAKCLPVYKQLKTCHCEWLVLGVYHGGGQFCCRSRTCIEALLGPSQQGQKTRNSFIGGPNGGHPKFLLSCKAIGIKPMPKILITLVFLMGRGSSWPIITPIIHQLEGYGGGGAINHSILYVVNWQV